MQECDGGLELEYRDALAIAVSGEHGAGAEDDGFGAHLSEPGGLGTEGDGDGLGGRGEVSEEAREDGAGGGGFEAVVQTKQVEAGVEGGVGGDDGVEAVGDEAGGLAGDGAPLDEKGAGSGDDVFCGAALDLADVERGEGRVELGVAEVLEFAGEGFDSKDEAGGVEDGGAAGGGEGRVCGTALDGDASEAVAFAGVGGRE